MQVFANADDEVALLAAEADTGRGSVQLDHPDQLVGLVPDPHRAIRTARGKQTHLGTAGQACHVVRVVLVRAMVVTLCGGAKRTNTRVKWC